SNTPSSPLRAESKGKPADAEPFESDVHESNESKVTEGEEMNTPPLSQSHISGQERDKRRSSRIERPVSLIVLGTNRRGEIFQERTSAVSVNLHGCRYSSRHEYAPEGWVTLQVTGTDGANSRPVRARVRSVFTAHNSRELCQVGVELETPGNVWGIPAPPEDWQQLLGALDSASRGAAVAVAPPDTAQGHTFPGDRQAQSERRSEVTVFPGPPPAGNAGSDNGAEKDNPPTKAERIVVTAEQLLQALQGKLQLAADKAVQSSLSTQLDDAVKVALGKIEDGWKANVRQTEEFSASHLAEAKSLWETELHAYRDRAEEVARRIEALTALAQQALSDSQKFVERFANETAPQLETRLNESFARSNSQLETRAAEITAQQLAQINENAQRAMAETRAHLDQAIAQTAQAQSNATTAEPAFDAVSRVDLEARLDAFRAEASDRFEKHLSELYADSERKLEAARNRVNDLATQLEGLAMETRQARSQHEQGLAEVRSQLTSDAPGISQDQLNSNLTSFREGILSHLEWRLGEVSGHFEQLHGQNNNRANEISQQLDRVTVENRNHLIEYRNLIERAPRGLAPQDLASVEQCVDNAKREFENAAARVSDRHLIRLMEQKQVVTQEASLELEARSSETRALLQKVCNNTLEEFRRRVESQVDQILAEARERVSSSMASLDAESRAAVEARRRSLESDVARAAEQSTMEFRSGIKAFLYSCLVAAVSAVDQHAQTTLVGLSNDPNNVSRALEATSNSSPSGETPEFPPKAAGA
ncbi:MAG: hypothetical protein WBU20_11745, partial [Candidatus Acidiferrum sp.]